jgi:hypothetical protein
LEGCEDIENDGDEEDDFVVLDDPLTVDVLKPLLVAGASLVTVGLIVTDEEYDPEKLDNELGVFVIIAVRLFELVIVLLTVAQSVVDVDSVLEIRELTELVLVIVPVLVIIGVNVWVTELVVVAESFVVLVIV